MIRQLLASRLDVRTTEEGKGLSARRNGEPSHPWEVLNGGWIDADFGGSMKGGAWLCTFRPGFVNGIDPIVRNSVGYDKSTRSGAAVASDRASRGGAQGEVAVVGEDGMVITATKREHRPLLSGALIALDFSQSRDWPGESGAAVPLAIQRYGVPARKAAPSMKVNADLGIVQADAGAAPTGLAAGTRVAKTVDIVLGVARYGLQESVTLGSLATASAAGRLVTYNAAFDARATQAFGFRPFIYQMPDYDGWLVQDTMMRGQNTMVQRLLNVAPMPDDMIDKRPLVRVWAISPPVTEEQAVDPKWSPVVAADWTLEFEYRTFWNLNYRQRVPVLRMTPMAISYHSGLAFGIGDAIVNQSMSFIDEATQRFYLGMTYLQPEGKFWTT